MLNFQDFFQACSGVWKTERIYHTLPEGQVERSFTEFRVEPLTRNHKQTILDFWRSPNHNGEDLKLNDAAFQAQEIDFPGFAIAFNTESETGEKVSMQLSALFVPEPYAQVPDRPNLPLPTAAQVPPFPDSEIIKGVYLRDEGYSEGGAIAGHFTYQATRQTLEMTTYYRRSVAVDQMRFLSPDTRLRTIVTYRRPDTPVITDPASYEITLIGFGLERRQSEAP